MRRLLFLLLFCPTCALAQVVTPIGAIQTSGATATAGTYTVEGVVTAVYPGWGPAGFFVQNDAATADADAATSDALFVVQTAPTVQPGDRVRVSGAVVERTSSPSNGMAVLTAPVISVLAGGQPLPAFALLDNATFEVTTQAEALEGMRVQFSAPLTVTEPGAVRSRGELTLSLRGLTYQPTQIVDPNDAVASGTTSTGATNVAAVLAYAAANVAKTLLLDDGRVANGPQPTPYVDAAGAVRVGSTVANLRGIMGYGSNKWRIQPLPGPDAPVVLTERPAVPTFSAPPDLRLASFNVLNFFNGDGAGGGFPTSRGANTLADFRRQRAKIITAISQLDADVLGLMEIENDGTGPASAIQDLVRGLNQRLGAGTYAFVDDGPFTQFFDTDLIRCAILYKPAAVTPVGAALLGSDGIFSRPPLAQVFVPTNPIAVADTFAFVVNHLKSKASGSGVDADQGDGQGRSNDRRRRQAGALAQFLNGPVAAAGGRRAISVGDYNANYQEDPLDVLRAAGLLIPAGPEAISYVFSGLAGALDHAVITPVLAGAVEVHKWNINAVEPTFLQYDAAGAATDTLSPFRSSDHDPVLIGLRFAGFPPTGTAAAAPAARLRVFPNPASGGFYLELPGVAPTRVLTLDVLTATGQRILTVAEPAAALPAALARRTAALPAGVYWLHIREGGFGPAHRVVKE